MFYNKIELFSILLALPFVTANLGLASTSPVVSSSGTTIPAAANIVDAGGNVWTVSNGVVYQNNVTAGYTAQVTLLLYYNQVIYQQNSAGNWWLWSASWVATVDPRPDVVVTSISASPANPAAGQAVTFSVTVKNQGLGSTPAGVVIGVSFWIDGSAVSWADQDATALAHWVQHLDGHVRDPQRYGMGQ